MPPRERRLAKLEADAGINGKAPTDYEAATQIDEEIFLEYTKLSTTAKREMEELLLAWCSTPLSADDTEPLAFYRNFLPLTADLVALALKRAGRTVYDECAGMSASQIEARVHARFTARSEYE